MMFPTACDLPEQTRQSMCALLQSHVSDGIDLFSHVRQAHWTLRGPNFIGLHELLETIYEQVKDQTDLLAERLQLLGGHTEGTIDVAAQNSRLPKYPLDAVSPSEHVDAVTSSLAAYAKTVRGAIDEADEAGDMGTSDLFTEIVREVDRARWMIEAHKPVK
ncbi:DNA starvation/stationary phase protection protein Dps [Acuticoccus sp.]|uniref:DNA starvation/stationary phase protection protein Dps n=1 Tax=Acuticoccus sp. TaxID=1904378 RepID=UPI003B52C4D0